MVTVKGQLVEFDFYRPRARKVRLVGDFTNWQQGALNMVPSEDGYWRARMRLPAGEFKFRYVADGEWYTDYAAFGVEPGKFGLDSVVRVPHKPLQVPAAPPADGVAAA